MNVTKSKFKVILNIFSKLSLRIHKKRCLTFSEILRYDSAASEGGKVSVIMTVSSQKSYQIL